MPGIEKTEREQGQRSPSAGHRKELGEEEGQGPQQVRQNSAPPAGERSEGLAEHLTPPPARARADWTELSPTAATAAPLEPDGYPDNNGERCSLPPFPLLLPESPVTEAESFETEPRVTDAESFAT